MFFLKACPKCHGDMYVDRDRYGSFIECIHCGLIQEVKVNEELDSGQSERVFSAALIGVPNAPSLAA